VRSPDMSSTPREQARTESFPPRRTSEDGIYGTILTACILAAEGASGADQTAIVATVIVTLGVFWFAHVYARLMSRHLETRRAIIAADLKLAARDELALLESGLIPVFVLVVARALGADGQTAVILALLCSVAELLVLGVAAARQSGFRGLRSVLYGVGCGFLGVALVALETVLRHEP
jgi:hypothetical protein